VRKWLKEKRLESGMTMAQAAEKLSMSESYYAYIEAGERQKKMDISLVSRLSVLFGMPVQQIVDFEEAAE